MNGGSGLGSETPHWTFGGALLYSLTLLTTVGYARLSPRTSLGKIVTIIYALIGVPLMLILLSTLGSMLAVGVRKGYSRICCKSDSRTKHLTVGYHKAPSSPAGKNHCKTYDDSATIQIQNTTPNHTGNCNKLNYQYCGSDHQEVPKRAILATVRATHTRGRCRQTQVKQMLAEPSMCQAHMHGTPTRNCITAGSMACTSDVEEADDPDDSEHVMCSHDTPSRIPLIWRPPESSRRSPSPEPPDQQPSPSVPVTIVLLVFFSYLCVGAVAFASSSGWSLLDSTYFCFLALSTIGIGDKVPQSGDVHAQMQLLACCLYVFVGLVVVAMCFSLVHEELAGKCRQLANNMGLARH